MPNLIEQSFGFNIRILRLCFFYPPNKNKCLYRFITHILYFTLIIPVPILQCLNLYLQENITFQEIADNTFLIAELGCFIPKYAPFLNNGERIKNCINYFDAPIFKTDKPDHLKILRDCIKVCRWATTLYTICVATGVTSWASRPIAWENHIFPTDLWLPFDPKTAPKLYNCLVYIYLVTAVGYECFICSAVDPLVGGLAYQATSQIRILKNNLQFLAEQVDEELDNPENRNDFIYEKIRKCVVHHNLILDFVKEYETCFSQVAFSQFAGAVVVFCVTCLQLTIVDIISFNFLAMMMYLVAMVSEVYLYCHFGTILYEENNTLNDAIYQSRWYEFDVKSRKALILLMERAKKPIIINCGYIFDMSLVTFTMLVRRAYSLLAVLENYKF